MKLISLWITNKELKTLQRILLKENKQHSEIKEVGQIILTAQFRGDLII